MLLLTRHPVSEGDGGDEILAPLLQTHVAMHLLFGLNSSHICSAFPLSSRELLACTSRDVSRRPAGPQSFLHEFLCVVSAHATWHPDTNTPSSPHTLRIPLEVIPSLGLDIETKPGFLQRIASFPSAEMPFPLPREGTLSSPSAASGSPCPVPSPQSPQGSNLVTHGPGVFSSFHHIQHNVDIILDGNESFMRCPQLSRQPHHHTHFPPSSAALTHGPWT